ncbi:MAG: urease accessory protein UreD [Eubacteriales bacterium]|nr:urease accessory protein UreD [Eubacteriales bacterium]
MGRLYIETARENGRTVIRDSFFTAPFKITAPFYSGDTAEIMIMQASAGILEGDSHEMEFVITSGSQVIITGQSYTKLFRMEHGRATQRVRITVEKDAFLCYLPRPVIPFKGSAFLNTNEIHLEPGAKFAMQDILSCGRKAMGERFDFRKYHARTVVYEDGKPIFVDNTRLVPSEFDISGMGWFEHDTHQGMAYFYGLDKLEAHETDSLITAVTEAKKGQLMRFLGSESDEIERSIRAYIEGGNYHGISCDHGYETVRQSGAKDSPTGCRKYGI